MTNFDKFDSLKKDFIKKYESQIMTKEKAAQSIGRTRQTIWNWQQDDPEFDEAVKNAQGKQEELRVEKVKDSLFKRIVKGEAAASETIFWLINKSKGEFKDKHQIEGKHKIEHKGGLDITELHKLAQDDE